MAQKTKLKPETNSSGTKESSNNQSRSGDKLSMSGQLQITNLGQIQTQLDSLTKKRFVELEVKLTGDSSKPKNSYWIYQYPSKYSLI